MGARRCGYVRVPYLQVSCGGVAQPRGTGSTEQLLSSIASAYADAGVSGLLGDVGAANLDDATLRALVRRARDPRPCGPCVT